MGSGHVPPDLLVTPAQLSRYNVPSLFLAQFALKPFVLTISTAGTLGTMQFTWALVGDANQSAPIVSSGGTSWAYTLDDVFADLTFAAGTYALNSTYTVDASGTVTPGVGALNAVTASRFDLRQNACSAATTEAMTLMRDAIRPPLLTWGDDATTHAAMLAYSILLRGRGSAPLSAAAGDEVVFTRGEDEARKFFRKIGEDGKPDSMTDTSPSVDGPLIPIYPFGDPTRNW